jgi:hypothetical protein
MSGDGKRGFATAPILDSTSRFGSNIRSFVVTVKSFLFMSRITDRALFSCKRLTALPSVNGLHKE